MWPWRGTVVACAASALLPHNATAAKCPSMCLTLCRERAMRAGLRKQGHSDAMFPRIRASLPPVTPLVAVGLCQR